MGAWDLSLLVHARFGVALQQAHYIVILSALLQNHYLGHLRLTKLGDLLGTGGARLLGARA